MSKITLVVISEHAGRIKHIWVSRVHCIHKFVDLEP